MSVHEKGEHVITVNQSNNQTIEEYHRNFTDQLKCCFFFLIRESTHVWTNEGVNAWMNKCDWTNVKWINEYVNERVSELSGSEWMDDWMSARMKERVKEWTGGINHKKRTSSPVSCTRMRLLRIVLLYFRFFFLISCWCRPASQIPAASGEHGPKVSCRYWGWARRVRAHVHHLPRLYGRWKKAALLSHFPFPVSQKERDGCVQMRLGARFCFVHPMSCYPRLLRLSGCIRLRLGDVFM